MSRRRVFLVLLCAFVLAIPAVGVWLLRSKRPSPPALQGRLRREAIDVDGRRRTFALYVPRRLRPDPPLLLVLHGSMMNGARMRADSGYSFDQIADREGILVVYPDGHGGHWNDCRAAGDFEAKRLRIDDVAFLRALAGRFRREHGVPADRVFAAGVSNGAQMSYRLALEAPDLVRGIAAIAANLPAAGNQTCKPAGKPVATMIVNGTGDPLNPHEGGEVALYGLFLRRGTVQSTLASARYWAQLAGLHGPPSEQQLPDADPNDGARATRLLWSAPNAPSVAAVVVSGGGHTIPHPHVTSPRLLGHTCHDFSAPDFIWEFFAAELRREAH
jgi:polyhydroxybutyrate depolymerase